MVWKRGGRRRRHSYSNNLHLPDGAQEHVCTILNGGKGSVEGDESR